MTFEERLEELKKDFEERLEELKAEHKKKEFEKPKEWIPEDGEKYWYVSSDGRALNRGWGEWCYDSYQFSIGNVFKTQEEAQFELERLRVLAEMKKYSKPFSHERDNYFIYFAHNKVLIDCCDIQTNDIYFENEEMAQKVIDEVGADRIKKYYLRVTE